MPSKTSGADREIDHGRSQLEARTPSGPAAGRTPERSNRHLARKPNDTQRFLRASIEPPNISFKRITYSKSVQPRIFDRMISERRQIAERFLSEGQGLAARIRGNRERDLSTLQSEAYRQVEEIRGVADAKATE